MGTSFALVNCMENASTSLSPSPCIPWLCFTSLYHSGVLRGTCSASTFTGLFMYPSVPPCSVGPQSGSMRMMTAYSVDSGLSQSRNAPRARPALLPFLNTPFVLSEYYGVTTALTGTRWTRLRTS